jgi:hypothetical protein
MAAVPNGHRLERACACVSGLGGPADLFEEFPRPYRIVDIAVLRSADLKPIQPDAANEHGFSQFFLYCIKCHSINSIGGSLGPELNLLCASPSTGTLGCSTRSSPSLMRSASPAKCPDFNPCPNRTAPPS